MTWLTRILFLGMATMFAVSVTARTATQPANVLESQWSHFYKTSDQTQPAFDFPHAECFQQSARKHGLPETLLRAVARGESDFNPAAKSTANAYGLMQILWPGTAHHLGIKKLNDLLDPCTNVEAGTRYLKELLEKYQGNVHRALAAYNYGPARIPVAGGRLPEGAVWYSGYIMRHLDYVLKGGGKHDAASKTRRYSGQGKLFVIHFDRPYRAAAFVESLQPRFGEIRLDWFRQPDGGFEVVMLYASGNELTQGKRLLSGIGF